MKKDYPAVAASLADAFLKNIGNETIDIEVSGTEFQINRIMRGKSLGALENICNDFFGKKMKLMIHPTKTENLFNEQNQTAKALKHDAMRHPLVQEAISIFKGEVFDIRLLHDPAK